MAGAVYKYDVSIPLAELYLLVEEMRARREPIQVKPKLKPKLRLATRISRECALGSELALISGLMPAWRRHLSVRLRRTPATFSG